MKIALVGYGKMGHMIEQAAKRAGHEVVVTIDVIAEAIPIDTYVPNERSNNNADFYKLNIDC